MIEKKSPLYIMPSIPPDWPADDHMTWEQAKAFVHGDGGKAYRDLVAACMAPLVWHRPGEDVLLHSGTCTFVRTDHGTFGVTADHVIEQYQEDAHNHERIVLRIRDATYALDIIDRNTKADLATFRVSPELLTSLDASPLSWPAELPQEQRGIALGGFPSKWKQHPRSMTIVWPMFFALTTARTVTNGQITVTIKRDEWISTTIPVNENLGGISGGPLIGIFELPSHVAYHKLAGIITEHPDYANGDFAIERVIATDATIITERGNIRP